MRGADLVAAASGAAGGLVTAELFRRRGEREAVVRSALGLVTAAVIYPAARRSLGTGGVGVEAAAVGATAALGVVAAAGDNSTTGRRLVAGGWVAHVLYDVLQGSSPDSRLPRWYPALCVGFDVALAGRLAA